MTYKEFFKKWAREMFAAHDVITPEDENLWLEELANILDTDPQAACVLAARSEGVGLSNASLTGADLFRANLTRANLTWASLSSANLFRAGLSGANLGGADLSGANLSSANLSSANLTSANLFRAGLSGANLGGADLSGANLTKADLARANLFRANLTWANLTRANLFRADLSGANLGGADLSSANLSSANLTRANLTRANLTGARYNPLVLLGQLAWTNLPGWVETLAMRFDATCHPHPEKFQEWGEEKGHCPLYSSEVEQALHFTTNRRNWKTGRAPSPWLMWRILCRASGIRI